ncbi:hypothetical protein FBQ81_13355 [Chloroflexi bacterium CFX6]|nr:hypothetical protein [Chloroflexi bacterium CFX6]
MSHTNQPVTPKPGRPRSALARLFISNPIGRWFVALTALAALALACNIPGQEATSQPPAFDPTRAALELQATEMSLQLTRQALDNASRIQPTEPPPPTQPPSAESVPTPTEVVPTATLDVNERIVSAKILVYEDTPYIGMWVKDTLDGMDLKYTHVGDALGTFMENLNSGVEWDLIIVAAEAHERVSGEFFDVITERVVRQDAALIIEMWYLDEISEGRIKTLTTQCGIELQKSYNLADSIYWLDSTHPVFNEPNNAVPLIHYGRYWQWQAGDYLRLLPGSDATLLAGMYQNRNSDYGVVASCFEGRVIFQTFCNHDYDQADIQLLWENYIYNTLKSRFAVVP